VGKLDGKRPHGRLGRSREENIKRDLQEMGCGGMDWTALAPVKDT